MLAGLTVRWPNIFGTTINLTFSLFQFATAQNIGVSPEIIVAAQAVGGTAGNMITVHNVVAAAATVGLMGKEGLLMRKTILPMIYYCLLTGSIVFIWIHGFGVNLGAFSLMTILAVLTATAVLLMRERKTPSFSPTPTSLLDPKVREESDGASRP